MLTLKEFDVRCRGSDEVVEEWRERQPDIRGIWQLIDLLSMVSGAIAAAVTIYDDYRRNGKFLGVAPQVTAEAALTYFMSIARKVGATAVAVEKIAAKRAKEGQELHGLTELRSNMARLHETLSAAEWHEVDLIAPSDEELNRYVEDVRPPLDYYTE